LPAHLQGLIGNTEAFDEFAGGVTSGFPIISYRGRTWRVRKGGEEQVYLNDQGEAYQSIEVCLIKSNVMPSKTYYEEKYNEGDNAPPRCWSADGIKPDVNVVNPIHPVCASCPKNAWGSKISENGNKTRACADVRRVAVAFKHELEQFAAGERKFEDVTVLLLRIPPASLNPLKDYAEKVLKPKGIPPFVLITKVGFDTQVSYPKLTFKAVRFLNAVEADAVVALRESTTVKRILNESLEHGAGESTEGGSDAATSPAPAQAEAPASASPASSKSSKKKSKLTPVEEEELNFSESVVEGTVEVPGAQPAPVPARPAAVESQAAGLFEEEQEEEVIAPAPAPAQPAAAAKPAAAKPAPAPTPKAADDDFEAMLSSILD
jgi:hypothetical protein